MKISLLHLMVIASPALMSLGTGSCATSPAASQLRSGSKAFIVVPQNATAPETAAAGELQHYLAQITGANLVIQSENERAGAGAVIAVGATRWAASAGFDVKALPEESWRIKSFAGGLIVTGGGKRGTLYAAYHFLEDIAGVRWWTPWQESVPSGKTLTLTNINKIGKPAFAYRDIFTLYGNDEGRFMARSRLNRQGDAAVAARYGGTRSYGPPEHAHTFFLYLPPEKYFPQHPDWYISPSGAMPTPKTGQLCLANPEMRAEFLRVLKENIRTARAAAIAKDLPPPDVFNVSQEDNSVGFVCGDNGELVKSEGSESAIVVDFVNFLADGIREEFPGVFIDTLAYISGEKAPKTLHARDNVTVRLTDTSSNVLLPLSDQRNSATRENLQAWSLRCKNLRVWDYAITYRNAALPQPNTPTFAPDLRFFLKNNVEGMFIECEEPLTADMREMKLWVLCKLLEDPSRDTGALVREFTDGYYGAAGPFVRRYLALLEAAAGESKADITWEAKVGEFSYLTLDFLVQADQLYGQAAKVVAGDAELSLRLRRARFAIDDAILKRYPRLRAEWERDRNHTKPEVFPLERDAPAARWEATQREQIDLQLAQERRMPAYEKVDADLKKLLETTDEKTPRKFIDVPAGHIAVYGPRDMRNYENRPKVVDDPLAENGSTTRFEIPDAEIEKYKLPMPWGIYDNPSAKMLVTAEIEAQELPAGGGYHWYRIPDVTFPGNGSTLYFFWSWVVQIDLDYVHDSRQPGQKYDVWASIKFEGPAFSDAKPGAVNAISIDRVVLVRK